jgi:hypothetical protein
MIEFPTNVRRKARFLSAVVAVALSSVWLPQTAMSQGPSSPEKHKQTTTSSTQPTSIRKSDLQGLWDFSSITPLERPRDLAGKEFLTEAEAADWARKTLERESLDKRDGNNANNLNRGYNEYWLERGGVVKTRRTSLIIDPPNGRLPALTDEGRKRVAANSIRNPGKPSDFDGPEDLWLPDRCLKLQGAGPPIHPTIYNNIVRIQQNRDNVVIFHEMGHEARVIPLDGRPHAPEQIQLWNGDPRGHWEGDTLIVETTNFRDLSVFPQEGPMDRITPKTRLIERFTRTDDDTLQYQFTIADPSMYTKPWTVEMVAMKTAGPQLEYSCQEGNLSNLTLILSGSRFVEKKRQEVQK